MLDLILTYLPQDFPWRDTVHYFDTIGSTNTAAKEMALQGASHGTVLVAGMQTAGRGRMGRSFHSPGSSGIYLSVILRPRCHASQLMHLTCAAGIAACDAVEKACGIRPGIKWINDLVFGKRKLGGILTELVLDSAGNASAAIIGIGINCHQSARDFPEEIQSIATSLFLQTGKPVSYAPAVAALVTELEAMSRGILTRKDRIMEQYVRDCVTIGQEVSVHKSDQVLHAKALDVDPDGGLIVRYSDGTVEAVNSGEVSVRGMYGYI